MEVKKVFRSVIISLLSVMILSFIFSFKDLSQENIEKETWSLIYEFASQESKDDFFSHMEQSCAVVNSGQRKDFESLKEVCKDFTKSKDFFLKLVLTSKEENQVDTIIALEKISNALNNKIIILSLIAIFITFLFLLSESTKEFILNMGKPLFHVGLFILISYAVLYAYSYFATPDTSSVFIALSSPNSAFSVSSVLSPLPQLILRTFNVWILVISLTFIVVYLVIKHITKEY